MKDESCTIAENTHIGDRYYILKIKAPYTAALAKPGQFVMVTVSKASDLLLKRPFGIFSAESQYIQLYYEVVGKGTQRLADLKPGDSIHVLGPLGNTFPDFNGKNLLLVAGGRGIAPIHFALEHLGPKNRVSLLYGARSASDLNLVERLEQLKLEKIFLYTDDGSAGKKGLLTADIRDIIAEEKIDATISCGPDAMFKALAGSLKGLDTENYVSMEALMGCGFGICYSCAAAMVDGSYKKVCADGPVFKMEDVQW